MANTLTNLIPDLYASLDVVSRELVGFIPAVAMDASANRVAQNQTLRSFVAPAATAATITPANTVPDSGTNTITNKTVTISNFRMVPMQWTGEEIGSMNSGGPGHRAILQNQMIQGMRTLVNEIEADLAGLYVEASRAYGTANTDPFATTLADTAQIRKILADNGAPMSDLQAVISTGAGAAFRTLSQVTKANEAGETSLLRQGVLTDVHGFALRESAQVISPTVGTAANATTNAAGYAIGATVITLDSAGTGTIVAGDIITFAGDTNKYVVASGDTDVSNAGTITLAQPGLRKAMSAATKAITVVASSAMNMAFNRNAIYLATRLPMIPAEGDMAIDRVVVQDPKSGLAFEFAAYAAYRQIHYELAIAWGVAMIKPEHCAIILGAA